MKGVIEKFEDLVIYILIFVTVASVLVMIAHGTPIAQNQCIITQSGEINNLKNKIKEASERGINIPHRFTALGCLKCMWYDSNVDQLMVVYSTRSGFLSPEVLMYDNYSISTNFVDMGCNCIDCGESNGLDPPTYCANVRGGEDVRYQFEINRTHIRCVNCPTESPTIKPCATKFEKCICPSGLCRKLNCGDSIVNASLDYAGDKKDYIYTLSSPKNAEINLTTNNGNLYWLYVNWDHSCARWGVYDCSTGGYSPQTCKRNNLQPGDYYISVSRFGTEPMSYNLTLQCT
jgi:hypothetical protein